MKSQVIGICGDAVPRAQELESFLAKLPRPTPTYAVQAGDIFQTAQLTEENSVAYHTTANAGSTPPTSGTTSSALRPTEADVCRCVHYS